MLHTGYACQIRYMQAVHASSTCNNNVLCAGIQVLMISMHYNICIIIIKYYIIYI